MTLDVAVREETDRAVKSGWPPTPEERGQRLPVRARQCGLPLAVLGVGRCWRRPALVTAPENAHQPYWLTK